MDSAPIHVAAMKSEKAVRFLVKYGFNANSVFENGPNPSIKNLTPLHLAVMEGKTDIVEFLIGLWYWDGARMDINAQFTSFVKGTVVDMVTSREFSGSAKIKEMILSEAQKRHEKGYENHNLENNPLKTADHILKMMKIKEEERLESLRKSLVDAQDIQDLIDIKEEETQRYQERIQGCKDDIHELHIQIQNHLAVIESNEQEIELNKSETQRLKSHNHYKTEEEVEKLEENIVKVQNKISQIQLLSKGGKSDALNDSLNCMICLEIPKVSGENSTLTILSCGNCDSLICSSCRPLVDECVLCRVRFIDIAPKRNKWAERFISQNLI